jgi:hypothetical protein
MADPRVTNSIPRTVDTNMSITSAEQSLALDKAFDDAFGSMGEGPKETPPPDETKPAEPETKPAPAETKPPPAETKPPEPETKPAEPAPGAKVEAPKPVETPPGVKVEATPTVHPDDEPDPELDAIRLHPDSRPETVEAFRNLRGAAKTERKLTKELREKVQAQEKELATSRSQVRPVSDPQVQTELETLRNFHQTHRIFDDSSFQSQYELPVRSIFDDIIKDVKSMASDQGAADQWEKEIRAAGPDKLDRAYWSQGVISQCDDPLQRDRLTRKISTLLEAQDKRNEFREKMVNEPNAYDAWQQAQVATYWKQFGDEAADEVKKLLPEMGDWASERDLALAKSAQERTAWESHNKTYKEYEGLFQQLLTDAATQGPRGMTRVAARATMAEHYKRELASSQTQLEKIKGELAAAQEELNKIANARSKVNASSGTSTGAKDTPRRRIGQTVDDAFKEHFGTT